MSLFARSSRRLPRPSARAWLLGLAWLALACRAVVPAGYMPAAQGDGLQWLGLCSGSGEVRAVAAAWFDMADEHGDEPALQAGHCAFAALGAAQALPPSPSGAIATLAPRVAGLPSPAHAAGHRYLERGAPLGARAPPSVA